MPPFYLIITFNYYITSSQTTCKNHSTIFNSFDNKDKITERLGILGKSFDDIHKSIQQRKDDIEKLKKASNIDDKQASAQVPGYLSYIFSPRTSTLVKEFEEFKQKMSETGMSAKDLAKEMGDDLSGEIKTYIKTCENGIWIIGLPRNRATMN